MAHILFITEKYHSGPGYGPTNNAWNLHESYECANVGTFKHLYIDPEDIWSSHGVDQALLNNQGFDAYIISVYHYLPSHEVARKFSDKLCYFYWDASISMGTVHAHSSVAHQICFDFGKGEEFPNVFCVEVPQSCKRFYKDDNVVKDIDVSFVGSMDAVRPDRAIAMQKLKDAGFNVYAGGGRGPGLGNLSVDEYANIHRRSRICMNFQCGHGLNRPQKKGRSWEIAACGAFMLANNPHTYQGKEGWWFEDGVDFISFDDNNLVDKVRYYLNNEEERKRISDNIYKKYQENYAPEHFWKKILRICNVNV